MKLIILCNLNIELSSSLFCSSITVRNVKGTATLNHNHITSSCLLLSRPQCSLITRLRLFLEDIRTQVSFTLSISSSSKQNSRISMPWPILGISSNGNTFEDLRGSKDSLTRKPRSLPTTVIQLQPYLYRHWKVNICFEANYKDIIVCFHKSVVRGDLSFKFMVSTLDKIRAVEKMFCGKDREPAGIRPTLTWAKSKTRAMMRKCHATGILRPSSPRPCGSPRCLTE